MKTAEKLQRDVVEADLARCMVTEFGRVESLGPARYAAPAGSAGSAV
jgi:hypothetical protein